MKSLSDKHTGLVLVAGISLILYLVSALPVIFEDTFHHYVYLADAFAHGRLNLALPSAGVHDRPDSFDDIAVYRNRFYLGLPPLPAIFILPLIPWRGVHADARAVAVLLGAVNVGLCFRLLEKIVRDRSKIYWLTAFFGAGTVHWFVASHGGAWYFAQVCAVFFLLLGLNAAFSGHGAAAGFALAGAFLCRQLSILALPAFLGITAVSGGGIGRPRRLFWVLLGAAGGVFVYLCYNFLRFGSPFETGYGYHCITGAAVIQYQRYGLFHPHYLPRNLYTLLFMPPRLTDGFPWFRPTPAGQALIFTSPALFYAFKAGFRSWENRAIWVSAAGIVAAQLFYCNNGSWQFGYRFILDSLPLLMVLIARGTPPSLTLGARAVIVLSILFNCWGIVALRNLI
ncbi:MAG TPA: hypothetical protein PK636_01165 [bacterium]|nr:hypothetical protein [bacterium]HPJ71275.1 hypothetical protein [bacterium]HPQ66139.1 hypothetical protein [bacterium]